MRHKFGLCLSELRKLRFQNVCNPLVVVLPCAFEQRLRGSILNERMLKGIRCLWWDTSLVHNLRLDQPAQLML
jgi:hypothetical protein